MILNTSCSFKIVCASFTSFICIFIHRLGRKTDKQPNNKKNILRGHKLKFVTSIKYLGYIINRNLSDNDDSERETIIFLDVIC